MVWCTEGGSSAGQATGVEADIGPGGVLSAPPGQESRGRRGRARGAPLRPWRGGAAPPAARPQASALVGGLSMLLFALEMLKSPRSVGALCPSSDALARHMVRHLPLNVPGKVVELGAGTGAITRALLRHGVPPHEVVAVERSGPMARRLRQRFPQITVIEGDAANLAQLLELQGMPVRAAVSGLPLRSLSAHAVRMIMSSLVQALAPGGMFIQFTYNLHAPVAEIPAQFRKVVSDVVWRNIPPARVDVFLMQPCSAFDPTRTSREVRAIP